MAFLDTIREKASELAESEGLILYDVKWLTENNSRILQVSLDIKDRPIDVDTCEAYSSKFNEILDSLNLIDSAYMLEVCSPGAERELRNLDEIKKAAGEYVYVKLKDPKMGIFEVTGDLNEVTDENITVSYKVKTVRKTMIIDIDNISLIRLAVRI